VPTEQNPYSPPRAEPGETPRTVVPAPRPGEPEGIGGWLIPPLLGLLLSPVRLLYDIVKLRALFQPATWAALTRPGSPAYHPLWAPITVFEVATNGALIAFTLVVLVLFLKRSRHVPMLMIAWQAIPIGVQVIDAILAAQIPALAHAHGAGTSGGVVQPVIGAAIWIPYFLKSRRVKNTFVR
jgi:hypothetical protein